LPQKYNPIPPKASALPNVAADVLRRCGGEALQYIDIRVFVNCDEDSWSSSHLCIHTEGLPKFSQCHGTIDFFSSDSEF
jgi:hypothetical protein